ncbi:hypothetical protein PCASD_16105 [Puccinia coronata f. sp. avenae]|uniref:Uncharacterized protein n=1 Tax=Puccinia coronata f. sp. avenae TaxID=200324 RepID=A0A2N5TXX1_9BASI|nr:hypothetical protein PCASD_16105 [Puccinia coronata f. sp. avenae]
MAKSASPAHADRFMRGAHLILQMVQQTALHQFTSPPPENLVVVGTLVLAGEIDNHFAQRCYDALGTVEDNFPSMGVKKQCCW